MKHPKALHTYFFVPNDAEGNEFLRLARKYVNREHYDMRLAGRNPNRQQYRNGRNRYQLQCSLTRAQSASFAVYFDGKTTVHMDTKYATELRQRSIAYFDMVRERDVLQEKLFDLAEKKFGQPAPRKPAPVRETRIRKFRTDEEVSA